jgi:hypothetical protein
MSVSISNKAQEINRLVIKLSSSEQEALLKGLQKQLLLAKAEKLESSVKPNTVNMQAIVEAVRLSRQERYAV